ncbi:protein white-like [Paramacrobiotus metropolitanus]|uniref:protein white-like n=1 Tax=Paramacrobiotus metropolitanus TaxID=2943436 RepID=UPI0024460425|nr:protein white-like [Paramacrobiotus metropolitanus]
MSVASFNEDVDVKAEEARFLPENGHYSPRSRSFHTKSSIVSSHYDVHPELVGMENLDAITLSWHNVNVWLPPPRKRPCTSRSVEEAREPKQILKNVSGLVRPGELLAIMGASGAGKTTLLNVLNGRNRGKLKLEGAICINNRKIGKAITSISAYVQQVDLFVGTLTVREHLIFQSEVRMDKHISKENRLRRVDEVIAELGLAKCANTKIGIPGRIKGISGGEMKRLAFASEVLTDPPLMFCDEPTSGLDAFMAQNVVSVLRDMAAKGKTVCCTIHQPSSEVFAMFDRLLLMSEGRVAYLGNSHRAKHFFAELGYPCPPNFNPADHYIHKLAIIPGREAECKERAEKVCDAFENSERGRKILTATKEIHNNELPAGSMAKKSAYKANWFRQFAAVMWRSALSVVREPLIVKVRLIQTIFIALLLGIIFLRQENTAEGVQNINGAIFLFLTNMTFGNLFAVINVFTQELPIFLREHFNGMYRVDVYFLSKTLVDVPTFIILPFIFTCIAYWMIGLNPTVEAFLIACAIVILFTNAAVSFGYLISCVAGTENLALALAPTLFVPLMLFGGFFLNSGTVPKYFIWLAYISWFKYGNEALVVNQWRDVTEIHCTRNVSCPHDGMAVLQQLHFNPDNLVFNIYMLFVLIIGFRLAAFFALLLRARKN